MITKNEVYILSTHLQMREHQWMHCKRYLAIVVKIDCVVIVAVGQAVPLFQWAMYCVLYELNFIVLQIKGQCLLHKRADNV